MEMTPGAFFGRLSARWASSASGALRLLTMIGTQRTLDIFEEGVSVSCAVEFEGIGGDRNTRVGSIYLPELWLSSGSSRGLVMLTW